MLENLKCQCGKTVSQQDGKIIIIKCRHCKRYIEINTKDIVKIEYKTTTKEMG